MAEAIEVAKVGPNHNAELILRYADDSDTLYAVVMIRNKKDKVVYRGQIRVPLDDIRQDVKTFFKNQLSGDDVGLSWKSIKKRVKSVTKLAAIKRVVRKVKQIVTDPRFVRSIEMASTIYPPLGVSYASIRKANNLLKRVASGDSRATIYYRNLMISAKAGNPKALKSRKVLRAVRLAQKDGFDVGGWLYNRPFRSPLMALNFDKSPPNALRLFYSRGADLVLEAAKGRSPKKELILP